MIKLTKALSAWNTSGFNAILKNEIEQIDAEQLPLQQGLSQGSYVSDDNFSVMIISISEAPDFLHAKTGIFYSGIISGCSCSDDPTPIDTVSEYCVVQFDINKATSEATVALLAE